MSGGYGSVQTALMASVLLRYALMAYAAWRDARTRTFPNGLALAFAAACAVEAVLAGGLGRAGAPDGMGGLQEGGFSLSSGLHALGMDALAAAAAFALLFALELGWRRVRGEPGLGMGDLKFLFGLMLVDPVKALMAFVLGLVALALTGLVARKRSLPLLPFIVGSYFAIILAGLSITLGM